MAAQRPISRLFRISLRFSLVLMLFGCLAFSWVGMKRQKSLRQTRAVASILELERGVGALSGYSWPHYFGERRKCRYPERHSHQPLLVFDSGPYGKREKRGEFLPAWLLRITGEECFHKALAVNLAGRDVDRDHLGHLATFSELQVLNLDAVELSPTDIQQIGKLRQLRTLCLGEGGITDAGMPHLAQLKQLQELELWHNPISDQGLAELKPLQQLKRLNLCFTKVTSEGVAELQQAIPECRIWWDGCEAFDLIGSRSIRDPNPFEIVRVVNYLRSLGKQEALLTLREYMRIYEDEWLSYIIPLLLPNCDRPGTIQVRAQKNLTWPESFAASRVQGGIPFYVGSVARSRRAEITSNVLDWVAENCELREQPMRPASDPFQQAKLLLAEIRGELDSPSPVLHDALAEFLRQQAERMVAHLDLDNHPQAEIHWSDERQEYVLLKD